MSGEPGERIPLSRPEIGRRERELVAAVLGSPRLALGPMLSEFESSFARWLGAADAVAVSSGTAALHLGVRGHGWTEGDEIVTSPLTFVATANVLLYERAVPVFADIDPVTLNLDPECAEAAVGSGTAGLLPVHIFGYPAAMPELERLASARGLGVLEDACQALGAIDSEGVKVGARGNPSTFAFYPNKQMTTGEGGVLIPADERRASLARSERNQGRASNMSVVEHVRLGFNYRMPELSAALGVAQLERLDQLLGNRKRVASQYAEHLGGIGAAPAGEGDPEGLLLPCRDRGAERRSWFVFPVQLPRGSDLQAVVEALAERGVQARAYLPCVHLMPHVRERFGLREGMLPVAEDVARRSLALPFHGRMREGEVARVAEALRAALS